MLVTAACSNWGCTAIAAAMAARASNPKLLHTPEREALLLDTMVSNQLINSTHGIIDDSVDGFPETAISRSPNFARPSSPALFDQSHQESSMLHEKRKHSPKAACCAV